MKNNLEKWQNFKLKIELVPSTAWNLSLYRFYKDTKHESKWRKIKSEIFEKEGKKCWICGNTDSQLEAHEFWVYEEGNGKHIQHLESVHHLCFICHKVVHIGFSGSQDGQKILAKAGITYEDLIQHFCRINNCTREDFEEYKKYVFDQWRYRSHYKWDQDFGNYDPTK